MSNQHWRDFILPQRLAFEIKAISGGCLPWYPFRAASFGLEDRPSISGNPRTGDSGNSI
jgi:hypothetical protein